ncbi:MAG: hypothetical protein E7655_09110 [Ruminococcaceae bacterium]|nr:hypothetical protein [Oscillospiraceae bacterium]
MKPYQLLIKNVKIIDGLSDIPFYGDIAVSDQRIVKVGDLSGASADKVVDGTGLTACPGFFDIHSHTDRTLMTVPTADNMILQGITCALGGHCGLSPAPVHNEEYYNAVDSKKMGCEREWTTFDEYMSYMEKADIGVNLFELVGTNPLRSSAMGFDHNRPATAEELRKMLEYTEEAMQAGAYGVSYSGDAGVPSHWITFEELREILKVCQKYDGVFCPHTRHHQFQYFSGEKGKSSYGLYDGPKGEMFVGRYHGLLEPSEVCMAANNCRLHISHITPSTIVYHPHSPALDKALAESTLEDIVDAPLKKGLDVTFDVLCVDYSIGAEKRITEMLLTGVLVRPDWMKDMTPDTLAEEMAKEGCAEKLRELSESGHMKVGMIHTVQDPYWFECFRIIRCAEKAYEGKTISEIAFAKGRPTVETVYETVFEVLCEIVKADPQATWAFVKDKREYQCMKTFMQHPRATIGTDMGRIVPMIGAEEALADNAAYRQGCGPYLFQGFIEYLVKATKLDAVMTLPQAVKRITSIPAQTVLHLDNYGVIRENAWANLVLLDEKKLSYHIDFTKAATAPGGVEYVFVNGEAALEKGRLTGARAGHVVRKGGKYE